MRVLVVTGIYPPDIGGPATHCRRRPARPDGTGSRRHGPDPDRRAAARPARTRSCGFPGRGRGRSAPPARWRGSPDSLAATTSSTPPASDRSQWRAPVSQAVPWRSRWSGTRRGSAACGGASRPRTFDDFQDDRGGPLALRGMRALRNWSARNATALLSPSPHLAARAGRWAHRNDVRVVPNGVRAVHAHDATEPNGHLRLVFVGRLVAHKHLDRIITAVAQSRRSAPRRRRRWSRGSRVAGARRSTGREHARPLRRARSSTTRR